MTATALTVIPHGVLTGLKFVGEAAGENQEVKCLCVDYEGVLAVSDPDLFSTAFRKGIGRSKAWGCGLISVAPVSA